MSARTYKRPREPATPLDRQIAAVKSEIEELIAMLNELVAEKARREKEARKRDDYYHPQELAWASAIEREKEIEEEQQAAEIAAAERIERKAKRAYDKVEWFFGRGENFPYFLTRAWRDTLPSYAERKEVDRLYEEYREIINQMLREGKRGLAEELVGDFLFMARQIQIGQPMFKRRR